jgi:hypothetical protein
MLTRISPTSIVATSIDDGTKSAYRLFAFVAEIVECCDAVGFGPHSNGAGTVNVTVVRVNVWLPVEQNADVMP